MSGFPGEMLYRMCKRCHAFVSASLDDKCGCARARGVEHVWFNESQLRAGIHACACGYVGTVSHGCKDGCSRLVAKIADVASSVTVHAVADCTAAAKAAIATATVRRIRITRQPGDPDARVVCECRDVIYEERIAEERATKFTCGKCGRTCTFKDAMLPDPRRAGKAFEMRGAPGAAASHGCEKTLAAVVPAQELVEQSCVRCSITSVLSPRRICDDCMRDEGAVRAQQREHGQPSAVAAARGVAPMLCVDDPCGDDVAEEA